MSQSLDIPSQSVIKDDASVSSTSESSVPSQASSSDSTKARELIILPKGFEPSETDVLIGRGKRARTHAGNERLKMLIEFMIPEYSAAGNNKDEKSYIIKEIVTQIRKSSPDGGFVKFNKAQGRWMEVGDFLAREKISQTFRDSMGDAYSSSNPFKRKRRSFEKQNSTILDFIKHRRGSSPTSVVAGGGGGGGASTSTPSTEPLPSPTTGAGAMNQPQEQSLHASHAGLTHQHGHGGGSSSSMMGMLNKRPGQIGFARRSMLQYGANPSPAGLHRPIPQFASASQLQQQQQHHARRVSMELQQHQQAHHGRRTSLPNAFHASAAYNPVLMTEMMNRQRMAHNAAMHRRASGF